MKIKTITCHDVYNLGASLQAYALQKYLQDAGHEVEIIDYKPNYLSGHYKLWGVYNPKYNKPIIKQLYLLAKLPERVLLLKRKKAFDSFTKQYLCLTQRFKTNEELKSNPPKADAYIAGSDQIWNTKFMNGRDPAFYLDFAPHNSIKISYAASLATNEIPEEYCSFMSKMVHNLDYVSVRESSSIQLIKALGRNDVVAVCDPVFLLSKEEWLHMGKDIGLESEKYILIYDFDKSPIIDQVAKAIAFDKGFSIYNVGPFKKKYAKKNYTYTGPIDFISLVRDASYIISNSFHATAFAIIFNKNFCVVKRTEALNERLVSLLGDLQLDERITSDFHSGLLDDISYEPINIKLNKVIDFSKRFLSNVLNHNCQQTSKDNQLL